MWCGCLIFLVEKNLSRDNKLTNQITPANEVLMICETKLLTTIFTQCGYVYVEESVCIRN